MHNWFKPVTCTCSVNVCQWRCSSIYLIWQLTNTPNWVDQIRRPCTKPNTKLSFPQHISYKPIWNDRYYYVTEVFVSACNVVQTFQNDICIGMAKRSILNWRITGGIGMLCVCAVIHVFSATSRISLLWPTDN